MGCLLLILLDLPPRLSELLPQIIILTLKQFHLLDMHLTLADGVIQSVLKLYPHLLCISLYESIDLAATDTLRPPQPLQGGN